MYGSTTKVSMNKSQPIPDDVDAFSREMTAGFATYWQHPEARGKTDNMLLPGEVRAGLVVLINFMCRATTGVSVSLVKELLTWANKPLQDLPPVEKGCDVCY